MIPKNIYKYLYDLARGDLAREGMRLDLPAAGEIRRITKELESELRAIDEEQACTADKLIKDGGFEDGVN